MPQALRETQRRQHQRRQRIRRRVVPAVVLGLLAVGGVAAALVVRDDEDAARAPEEAERPRLVRISSEPAPDLSGDLGIEPAPVTSRLVYQVRSPGNADISEQLWVKRPFHSRLESYAGPGPGPVKTETETGLRHNANRSGDAAPVVITRPPGLAGADLRVDPVVGDAVAAGLLERREWRRVLGRPCQVFRAGASVSSGELRRLTPGGEYADVCIDRAGHVLEDWWIGEDGRPIQQRLATEVEDGLPIPDDFFRLPTTPTVPADQGAGSVKAISADSKPPEAEFYVLDNPPAGFAHQGRFTVVPAQAGLLDPTQRNSIMASVADVWVRGADFLVVDQGGTLGGKPAFEYAEHTKKVDLGPLGQGEERPSFAGSELRVILPTGRHVRVQGTLPMRDLVAIARALRATPGGTLTFLEPT